IIDIRSSSSPYIMGPKALKIQRLRPRAWLTGPAKVNSMQLKKDGPARSFTIKYLYVLTPALRRRPPAAPRKGARPAAPEYRHGIRPRAFAHDREKRPWFESVSASWTHFVPAARDRAQV